MFSFIATTYAYCYMGISVSTAALDPGCYPVQVSIYPYNSGNTNTQTLTCTRTMYVSGSTSIYLVAAGTGNTPQLNTNYTNITYTRIA